MVFELLWEPPNGSNGLCLGLRSMRLVQHDKLKGVGHVFLEPVGLSPWSDEIPMGESVAFDIGQSPIHGMIYNSHLPWLIFGDYL